MKLSDYFRTPRGYKRLAIVLAVAILASCLGWMMHFVAIGVFDCSPMVVWLLFGLPVIYIVLLIADGIIKRRKQQPRKRFGWFCTGVFVVMYAVATMATWFEICKAGHSPIGVVTNKGLYNSIGIRKADLDKDYIYIAEYYNKFTHDHCYLAIHNNNDPLTNPCGLLELDFFDMNLHRIDGCALEVTQQGEGTTKLGRYIDANVGICFKDIFTNANQSDLEFLYEFVLELGSLPRQTQYDFYSRHKERILPTSAMHPQAFNLGWWHHNIYDKQNDAVAVSFMLIDVIPVNYPAYTGK